MRRTRKTVTLQADPDDLQIPTASSFLIFTIIGLIIGLNQFGDTAIKLLPDHTWIHSLVEPLININSEINQDFTLWLLFGAIAISILIYWVLREGLKKAFCDGVLVGFLTFPFLVVLGAIASVIIFIIIKLFGLIFTAIGWLLTPIAKFLGWLLKPVGLLLKKLYLWIEPVLQAIAFPFKWFFAILWKYLLKYLIMLVGAILLLLICIFPFVTIGAVVIGNYKDSITKPISHLSAYSMGIGMGFLFLDIIICIILNYYNIIPGHAYVICIFTLLTLLLALIFLFRCIFVQGPAQPPAKFWDLTRFYVKHRKIEMITSICLIGIFIVLSIFFKQHED